MAVRDIIVVGASAGGVEALSHLASVLPRDLGAAVFVVCHFPADERSVLPDILSRRGPLPAHHAVDDEPIRNGRIYVAPRDYHLLLQNCAVRLDHGARENRARPAVDPLFRSAARAYGERVIGIILSGSMGDGAAGLLAIRSAGGVGIVQEPSEAMVASMPLRALEIAGADHIVSVADMGPLLARLSRDPAAKGESMSDPMDHMPQRVTADMQEQQADGRRGEISTFTCPECGGSMWQVDDDKLVRFRCHTGHAFYGETLLQEQADALEAALWTAIRIFKERMVLAQQLAARERARNNSKAAERFDDDAHNAERY